MFYFVLLVYLIAPQNQGECHGIVTRSSRVNLRTRRKEREFVSRIFLAYISRSFVDSFPFFTQHSIYTIQLRFCHLAFLQPSSCLAPPACSCKVLPRVLFCFARDICFVVVLMIISCSLTTIPWCLSKCDRMFVTDSVNYETRTRQSSAKPVQLDCPRYKNLKLRRKEREKEGR